MNDQHKPEVSQCPPEMNSATIPDIESTLDYHVSDYVVVARHSDEFERSWSPQKKDSIERCLDEIDDKFKELLFERLLEIDISMRFETGVRINLPDYRK